ncbi:MAG: glycerol-3-phosphate 1-O-acyltransferase PlsY [Bdellovibrionota bacterium]|nr:MAG: glycerol-3-phosphate 1-O-acyltransferase PlsY [Bdellovibrionota bacterium]
METILFLLALVPFYLIGSFPSGYLVSKHYGVSIGSHGSGNVGATNVTRILGARPGSLTLVVDIAKGVLAAGLANWWSQDPVFTAWSGVAAVCGHCFSLPPLLKGGKGVATSLGAVLYLAPTVAMAGILMFAAVTALSRYVSLGSVTAVLSTPVVAAFVGAEGHLLASLAMIAAVVTWRHRANLQRLAEGRELRLGQTR